MCLKPGTGPSLCGHKRRRVSSTGNLARDAISQCCPEKHMSSTNLVSPARKSCSLMARPCEACPRLPIRSSMTFCWIIGYQQEYRLVIRTGLEKRAQSPGRHYQARRCFSLRFGLLGRMWIKYGERPGRRRDVAGSNPDRVRRRAGVMHGGRQSGPCPKGCLPHKS
jgi:hypothetical protein